MTLNPYSAWEEYNYLEKDFMNYLRYVPLVKEHDYVWSLYLGDLLIRTGSILDSFFRRAIFGSELDIIPDIERTRALDDIRINIGTYRKIFDPFYNLSSKNIYELPKFNTLTPFFKWKNEKPDDKLFWWDAYNEVKHDRFGNQKKATLKATVYALSALFILNVIHLGTMPVLVDYGVKLFCQRISKRIVK